MKRLRKWMIILSAIVFLLLTGMIVFRHRFPVLVHLFSDCSCTDYSEEVTGFTVFNPFRDRAPERFADALLEDFSHGRCPKSASDELLRFISDFPCHETPHTSPSFQWKLRNRINEKHRISLFYNFGNATDRFEGEGIVVLEEKDGLWKAVNWDVIW